MIRFSADTGCLVAAFSSWHPKHARALGEIERRIEAGECFCVVAHTVFETYSVLTRLPPPHRLSSPKAFRLISDNLCGRPTLQLSAIQVWEALQSLEAKSVAGGATYDGLIALTAKLGDVRTLLTLNPKHFGGYQDYGFDIVAP